MTAMHRWVNRLRRPAVVLAVAGALTASSGVGWSRQRHQRVAATQDHTGARHPRAAARIVRARRTGTVSRMQLPSGDRGGASRSTWVYRPAVPDSAELPVLYYLHGDPGGSEDLGRNGVPALLDRWIAAGGQPFVLVAADGNSDRQSDTEWADSADGSVRLESFLIHTLIPAIEGDHPRTSRHRAIIGLSMGGYGAVNIALHHPTTFAQVISVAGYYVIDDPDGVGAGDPRWQRANDPRSNIAAAKGLRFLFLRPDGEDNPLMLGEDARFAPLLLGAGASEAQTIEGPGSHGIAFLRSELPTAFRFLASGWTR